MPFSYANPLSSPCTGSIGWFNFEDLIISPIQTVTRLTETLNDGSIVTFDMPLALVSRTPRQFNATSVPTYPSAQFGFVGYTGLSRNVAMYAALLPCTIAALQFTIRNLDSFSTFEAIFKQKLGVAECQISGLCQ